VGIERFIARRYLYGRKRFTFINIISLLATLGILFGVAALIVVMSVFNGFNGIVTSILQDFDPHLKIERVAGEDGRPEDEVRDMLLRRPDLAGLAPVVQRKAMLMRGMENQFAWVKGVDRAAIDGVSRVRSKLILGNMRFDAPGDIVLGIGLADRLRVLVGDTLVLYSPAGLENMLTQYATPMVLRCRVSGVYESKNKLYDGGYAFLSLRDAQGVFRTTGVTGFEARLRDIDHSGRARDELAAAIGPGWKVSTWEDLHKDLYAMMAIERWSAFIILGVIVAVAVFNILASLTMLVLEKKRDIGVLRAMGMPAARIERVFLLDGLWIGLIGTVSGLVVGLGLTLAQLHFGLVRLDAAFIIPAIPVEIRPADIALIVVLTFLLCLAAAWYPARRARAVEIIDAVRWE
jgi:lipoprotein-releasing system permease protein